MRWSDPSCPSCLSRSRRGLVSVLGRGSWIAESWLRAITCGAIWAFVWLFEHCLVLGVSCLCLVLCVASVYYKLLCVMYAVPPVVHAHDARVCACACAMYRCADHPTELRDKRYNKHHFC
jgi:hypothetical protein